MCLKEWFPIATFKKDKSQKHVGYLLCSRVELYSNNNGLSVEEAKSFYINGLLMWRTFSCSLRH